MKRGKAWGVLTWRGVTDATPRRIRCAAVCYKAAFCAYTLCARVDPPSPLRACD
jgi:hypothetical protein